MGGTASDVATISSYNKTLLLQKTGGGVDCYKQSGSSSELSSTKYFCKNILTQVWFRIFGQLYGVRFNGLDIWKGPIACVAPWVFPTAKQKNSFPKVPTMKFFFAKAVYR